MGTTPTPLPDLDTVRAEERRIMSIYAPIYRASLIFNSPMYRRERRRFSRWILSRLRRAGRTPESLRILDAGCGAGEILEHLHESGCVHLTGLDMTERMLEESREHLPESARLVEGTIEEDPFGDERFDVILAAFTVHHLRDPSAFFRLCDRRLAPGGRFFVLEYNGGSFSHTRTYKRAMNKLVVPLRGLLKIKNRRALAARPDAPRLFNPVHHLLSWDAIQAAMPRREDYALGRTTHGFQLATYNFAFASERGVDGLVMRAIDTADWLARPLGCGYFQWIEGVRRE